MTIKTNYDLSGTRHVGTRDRLKSLEELVSNHSPEDKATIARAASLMIDLHCDQKDRPDGTPYVDHPLDVTITAIGEFGFTDPSVIVAALLHDSVEDQPEKLAQGSDESGQHRDAALARIEAEFGKATSSIVSHLTNPDWGHIEDITEKNKLYREHFQAIANADQVAFAVKLADFSTNALRLDQVKDRARYDKLRTKYCPIIQDAIELLNNVPDTGDILSGVKSHMLPRLSAAAIRDCEDST